MHRAKHIQMNKALALLLSLSLLLTAVFGGTFAQIITRTPSLLNTFLSGLDPTGDLIISKEVTHPFGGGYPIPSGLSFDFTVSLGEDFAGKTLETSEGEKQADDSGNITVTAAPDKAVRIQDIPEGASVTVTEAARPGFTPNGGAKKTLTIHSGDNEVAYTNAYAPAPVTPVNLTVSGTKVLEGRDWQEGDSFTFLLEYKLAGTEDQWTELGEASVTYELVKVTDPETGDISFEYNPDFDKFSFTELVQSIPYAAAGEYSFRVSEVDGTIGGITYDKVVSYFDVLVGDADMDGSLEIQDVTGYQNAAASYDASTKQYQVDVTVNNKYAPAGTAGVTIHINKSVLSRSGEEKSYAGYTFELYDKNGTLVATSGETSAAGETSIALTYDAKDAGTTFHYTLKETHSGMTHNGLTYDSTVYSISVSVVDNLDGTIRAYVYNTRDYKTEPLTIEPEETQPAEGEQDPAEDAVTPTEGIEDPTEGTDAPTEGTEDPTESTDPPTVSPSEPAETEPVETEPEETEAAETEPEETEAATAETEEAPADDIAAASIEESLEVTSAPAANMAAAEETRVRSSASAPPEIIRGFNPSEPPLSNSGISNETDTPVKPATTSETKEVTIIPEGAGSTYSVSFVNVYDPDDTQASFGGTKELTGRDLKEGDFAFALYYTGDSFTVREGMQPVQTVVNDADGDFAFASIDYSKVGTYRYVVMEDASAKLGGVTYDDSVFHVIVTVADENGVLKASTAITDELGAAAEIKFHNTYKAAAASVTFTGTKTLTGADLTADMFQFNLYQADQSYTAQGAALAGASNDASGQFAFDSISYSEPGTFYYVVKEDTSADVKGMTYDDTVYGIQVSVSDDGSGSLHASVTITADGGSKVDAILFENSYTKPVEPSTPSDPTDPTNPSDPTDPSTPTDPTTPTNPSKPSTPVDPNVPATGDDSPTGLYIALVAISIVAISLLLITGKKKKRNS